MALVDGTKWLFAQTLRKMLLSRTLHQIRITELCTSCGADRQTFREGMRLILALLQELKC